MSEHWLGPTYEFRSGEWTLVAGIPIEEGRLEWILQRRENGAETTSHSFVLEPHGTKHELALLLGELPPATVADLVAQVALQTDPRLLSDEGSDEGLA